MARFYNEDGSWIEGEPTRAEMEKWIGGLIDIWWNCPRKGEALVFADTFHNGQQPNPTLDALFGRGSGAVYGRGVHLSAKDCKAFDRSERRLYRQRLRSEDVRHTALFYDEDGRPREGEATRDAIREWVQGDFLIRFDAPRRGQAIVTGREVPHDAKRNLRVQELFGRYIWWELKGRAVHLRAADLRHWAQTDSKEWAARHQADLPTQGDGQLIDWYLAHKYDR